MRYFWYIKNINIRFYTAQGLAKRLDWKFKITDSFLIRLLYTC